MRPPARHGPRIRPSVLDRLRDAHPDQARDAPEADDAGLPELLRHVRRDLEALLNARRPWRPLDGRHPDLRCSPLGYGLSDVTAGALNHPAEREALRGEIEALIRRFEPRLAQVRVVALKDNAPLATTLPLAIEALLLMDPEPEPVRFGTVVDPASPDLRLRTLREH